MATTTVRVDAETHELLAAMSHASGSTLQATVRAAAEALQRQRFAHQVADELAVLRRDEAAWTDYLADAEVTSVADGVGQ